MTLQRTLFGLGVAAAAIAGNVRCASTPEGYTCPALVGLPPRLVVPAPGATGVSTTIGNLIVTMPADGTFVLTSATAPVRELGVTTVPSPGPTGLPAGYTPSDVRDVRIPALASNVTYTLEYTPPYSSAPCGNGEGGGSGGSFTTGP